MGKVFFRSSGFFVVVVFFLWLLEHPALNVYASDKMGSLELIVEGLDFPSNIASMKDDAGEKIFVLEKNLGKIRVIRDGKLIPGSFLDIRDLLPEEPNFEQGILGLAFPPEFSLKKNFYVTYNDPEGSLKLSRFKASEDLSTADKSSETILLVTKNFGRILPDHTGAHHCGHLAFGPLDNFLYFCIGDSDRQGNPKKTAQRLDFLQGKILRLDVESAQEPYAIPADNPFVAKAEARPEIWAYGLRNPWGFSFDPLTGDLFIPDVGWKYWEEISFQPASSSGGENYGWALAEGNRCRGDCDDSNIIWPFYEYSHGDKGCAVIGGAVYRGRKFPKWDGVYLFSDFCSGQIWGIRGLKENPQIRLIASEQIGPTVIAPDPEGEVLVVDGRGGRIFRLNFPDNYEDNWEDLQDVLYTTILTSRRSSPILKELQSRKSWKLAEGVSNIVWYIRRAFNRLFN